MSPSKKDRLFRYKIAFHAKVNLIFRLYLPCEGRISCSSRYEKISPSHQVLLAVALNSTVKNINSKGSFRQTKERNFTWATRRNDFLNTSTSRDAAIYSHCIVRISPYSTSCSGILFAWTTLDLDILRKFQCVSKPATRPNS